MSKLTDNLKLFVYDTSTDGKQTFNIDKSLADNFQTLDKMMTLYAYSDAFTYSQGMCVMSNGVIYESLQNENVGKPLTNTMYWKRVLFENRPSVLSILQEVYPIGSIYIGMTSMCPLSTLFGIWELISGGLTLQQANSTNPVGSIIPAGLPNISGNFTAESQQSGGSTSGTVPNAFSGKNVKSGVHSGTGGAYNNRIYLNASNYNSIYGNSDTVQPPAFSVNIWRRTA